VTLRKWEYDLQWYCACKVQYHSFFVMICLKFAPCAKSLDFFREVW
jgi:hypothetical protein